MLRGLLTLLTFGISTAVLGFVAIVAGLISGKPSVVFRLGKVWARLHFKVMGIEPVYVHAEHAAGTAPRIFLANHLSALDIWLMAAALPVTTRFVSKRSVFWIPFLGQAMAVAGFIPIDRGDRGRAIQSLARAAETVRKGASIILFPEGTRSRDGHLARFKRGAFHLALQAGVPVVPVAISGSYRVVRPRSIVVTPGPVRVTFGEPIDVARYQPDDIDGLMSAVRASIVHGLSPEELPLPAVP